MTPKQFVQFMRSFREKLGPGSLEAYIDRLSAEGRLQSIPLLPARFQRKVYVDTALLLVCAFQRALLTLDEASLWGHTLRVTSEPLLRGSVSGSSRSQQLHRASA